MKNTSDVRAYKKFSPGYFISEQLKINNMTIANLADRLCISSLELKSIILNKTPVSNDIASLLAKTFKTTPEYWKNIDTSFRNWLQLRNEQHI
jgi:plasmid maintenance system antidote protein VapI